jgi:hypothetical protein
VLARALRDLVENIVRQFERDCGHEPRGPSSSPFTGMDTSYEPSAGCHVGAAVERTASFGSLGHFRGGLSTFASRISTHHQLEEVRVS